MTAAVPERSFQRAVTDLAVTLGLRVWHDNDSRRNEAGLPDLIIVGSRGLLWRELKTAKGRVSAVQREWLAALEVAGQDAGVWRPVDLASGVIQDELRRIR